MNTGISGLSGISGTTGAGPVNPPIPPGAIEMENADPLLLEDDLTELDVETV